MTQKLLREIGAREQARVETLRVMRGEYDQFVVCLPPLPTLEDPAWLEAVGRLRGLERVIDRLEAEVLESAALVEETNDVR